MTADLDPGAQARIEPHRRAGAGRGRQQQVRAGWWRRPVPPPPRPPATSASAGRCRGAPGSGCARPSAPRRTATGSAGRPRSATPKCRAISTSYSLGPAGASCSAGAGSGSRVRSSTSSFSPRNAAQHPVRGQPGERLGEVEVVGELGPGLLLAGAHPGHQPAAGPHPLAQLADQVRVLGEPLGQDRPGAVQRGGRVGNAALGVDVAGRGWRAGRASGRPAGRRPAAPARPRGRAAPWSAASA